MVRAIQLITVVIIATALAAVLVEAQQRACIGEKLALGGCWNLPKGKTNCHEYYEVWERPAAPLYYKCAQYGTLPNSRCRRVNQQCTPQPPSTGTPGQQIGSCEVVGDIPGGVSYKCTAWGPVKFGDPASYLSLDSQPGTGCSDALKQKCGCLGGGTVVLNIPNFQTAGQAQASNVKGVITNIVSGSERIDVLQGNKIVATKSGATSPVPPDAGATTLTLAPGANVLSYTNTNQFVDAQSCFQIDYTFDLVNDPDYQEQLCLQRGGAWLADAPADVRCCGDDQLPPNKGGDIFNVAVGAICVKSQRWEWLTQEKGGRIVRIIYQPDGHANFAYTSGEVVVTNDGPRLCGPVVSELNDHIDLLAVHVYTRLALSGSLTTGNQAFTHGYVCRKTPLGFSVIGECQGMDSPLSQIVIDPQRVFEIGGSLTKKVGSVDLRYYCRSDGQWSLGLDDNKQACQQAGIALKQELALKEIPIQWTGSRCCGEAGPEYYADPLPAPDGANSRQSGGGCWEGKTVLAVGANKRFVDELLPTEHNFKVNGGSLANGSVINHNGTFHTCNLPVDHPVITAAGTCTPSQTCNADGSITLLDGVCSRRTISCPYGCELSNEAVCLSLDCPAGPRPVCRAGPLSCRGNVVVNVAPDGTLVEHACPGNTQCVPASGPSQEASCAPTTPSSTTMYAEIDGMLRLPTTTGCYASLVNAPAEGINWPVRTEQTQACYSATGKPRLFSNALECFSLQQANVQNEPFDKPAGITIEAHYLTKCVDWLSSKPLRLQPSAGAKLITDTTQNVFHTRVRETLADTCDCGILLARPPGLSDRSFDLWCVFRDPRVNADECIGPPRPATEDIIDQLFGRPQ